jgi:glyoxylase-like metal-dependent hydrolase (beta-lactamase superfamily II)
MRRILSRLGMASLGIAALASSALAQDKRPPIETTKVDGTDNVYVFRNQNHMSMFIVTTAGVIVTDPVAYGRPQGGEQYLNEIRKITSQPIRYVIYSHHHFDHIAGGKVFKDAGARFIAHRNATARLKAINDPHTVLPDESVSDRGRTIKLGNTTLDLKYYGTNHSDSSLVMHLPKDRLIFAVDWVSAGTFPGRGMTDSQPLLWIDSLKWLQKLDFDRFIPGHPGNGGRITGTKKDIDELIDILQTSSDTVKEEARKGRCWDPAEKELQLAKFTKMPGYEAGRHLVVQRFCGLWGRGT